MSEAGYDVAAYELNSALHAALQDPSGSKQRFEAKLKPFANLQGVEVPVEFLDDLSAE